MRHQFNNRFVNTLFDYSVAFRYIKPKIKKQISLKCDILVTDVWNINNDLLQTTRQQIYEQSEFILDTI